MGPASKVGNTGAPTPISVEVGFVGHGDLLIDVGIQPRTPQVHQLKA